MKGIIKKVIDTKQFHILMIFVIILFICLACGIIVLKYNVEGETRLPFNLTGISVISTVEGTDIENSTHKWDLNVNQNNDIYLYIDKNKDYDGTEIIKSVKVENFVINKDSNIGTLKLYKPDSNMEGTIFKNSSENECNTIEFVGDLESSIKDMRISNQGGLVTFRYAITDLGQFTSDDAQEIDHSKLLSTLGINNDDLKFNVSFDIIMELESQKSYKTSVTLDLPTGDVVNDGIQVNENKDMQNIVFKRN